MSSTCDEIDLATDASAEFSLGRFSDMLGYVLRIAQLTSFSRLYDSLPANFPLRLGEFTILLAISENPGIRQGEIADQLRVKWSNMTKIMRSFEKRGLLQRQVSPRDRRSFEIELTPDGRELVNACMPALLAGDRFSRGSLSETEVALLLALLRKLIGDRGIPVAKGIRSTLPG